MANPEFPYRGASPYQNQMRDWAGDKDKRIEALEKKVATLEAAIKKASAPKSKPKAEAEPQSEAKSDAKSEES